MSRADGAQAPRRRTFQVAESDERIGPFQAEKAADGKSVGRGGLGVAPKGDVFFQIGPRTDGGDFSGLFQGAIPGALPLGDGPGLCGRAPRGHGAETVIAPDAGDLGGDHQTDTPPAQFRQANGAAGASGLVAQGGFGGADFADGAGEIAVPFEGVEGQVEM